MKSVVLEPTSAFRQRGFTLVELIVATAILVILTGLAVPLARVAIKREKERELRSALWEMRDAIDRYKDAADRGAFQIKVGSEGYPPDLETLVKGVGESRDRRDVPGFPGLILAGINRGTSRLSPDYRPDYPVSFVEVVIGTVCRRSEHTCPELPILGPRYREHLGTRRISSFGAWWCANQRDAGGMVAVMADTGAGDVSTG